MRAGEVVAHLTSLRLQLALRLATEHPERDFTTDPQIVALGLACSAVLEAAGVVPEVAAWTDQRALEILREEIERE